MNDFIKICIGLILSVIVLLVIVNSQWPSELLEITFCNVGQGDATLIQIGFLQILIDTGPNDSVISCLENSIPFWDKNIEMLFLTHRDADHIGGLEHVLDYYSLNYIFINPSNKKTSDFKPLERFSSGNSKFETKILQLFSGSAIYLTNLGKLEIFWPDARYFQKKWQKKSHTETILSDNFLELKENNSIENKENNLSIAINLTYGKVVVFLPGDLEKDVELALSRSDLLGKVDLLKAGHHGSKTSSTRLFLDKIRPEKIVVSSGENNRYGHPHQEVLDRFFDLNAQVFLTSTSGDVTFVSDGRTIWKKSSH